MRLFTIHDLDLLGRRREDIGALTAGTLYEAHCLARGRLAQAPLVEIAKDGRRLMLLDRETYPWRDERVQTRLAGGAVSAA